MATKPISEEVKARVREAKAADPKASLRKLAGMFGLHNTTVMSILSAPSVAGASAKPQPVEDTPTEEEADGSWRSGKNWLFNGTTQTYILYLESRTRPLILSAEKVQAMKRAYSNWDGHPATINEICRRFTIPRDQFVEMKSILGWTHDQEPFTAEQVLERPAEDLAQDALQMKRQSVFEEFQKASWRETKTKAEKFDRLEQTFILPLRELVQTTAPTWVPQVVNIRRARNPFAVVANNGELHYGKAGWVGETGEEYNRVEAEQRLVSAREAMLQEVADRGRPDKFILAMGNDFLHIDNDGGTTTRGTPQDCDGTAARILTEGIGLALRDIEMLLQVAPVEIAYVQGNHDRLLSLALMHALAGRFHNEPRLTIDFDAGNDFYTVYGQSVLGFAHGDGALKPAQYIATMSVRAREFWSSTRHRYFFTGHLHTEVVRELTGGTHFQMKSLSGQDRYHARNAYLSTAGMNSYIVDIDRGVTNAITWLHAPRSLAA